MTKHELISLAKYCSDAGITVTARCKELGINYKPVLRAMRKKGVTFKTKNDLLKDKYENMNLQEAIDRNKSGESFNSISKDFGVPANSLIFAVKKLGYQPKSRSDVNKVDIGDIDLSSITKELTLGEISDASGVSPMTLSRRAKDAGVKFSKKTSKHEKDLSDFIRSVYNGEVLENDRSLGKELDIYIPELNMGIEFNGVYWHCDQHKPREFHISKKLYFKEKGVEVIMIWEDQWINSRPIIESIIKNKLGLSHRLYARKYVAKTINSISASHFMSRYHLQSKTSSSVNYGLVDSEGQLVMVLSMKKLSQDRWEIARLASKLNHVVIGGFSKLFKLFKKENDFKEIITYANLDVFDGKSYEKVGFVFDKRTPVSYFYIHNNKMIRYNRTRFQKHKLVSMGYPESLSESVICKDIMKLKKIYTCGNNKYVLKNQD